MPINLLSFNRPLIDPTNARNAISRNCNLNRNEDQSLLTVNSLLSASNMQHEQQQTPLLQQYSKSICGRFFSSVDECQTHSQQCLNCQHRKLILLSAN
jgi:hypothetical protein